MIKDINREKLGMIIRVAYQAAHYRVMGYKSFLPDWEVDTNEQGKELDRMIGDILKEMLNGA